MCMRDKVLFICVTDVQCAIHKNKFQRNNISLISVCTVLLLQFSALRSQLISITDLIVLKNHTVFIYLVQNIQ